MKMLLLDVEHNEVKVVDASGLDDYYKYINCRCIDIVSRKIGDVRVNIICDDEGLLVDNPKPSGISVSGEVMLCGNLLVTKEDVVDGELMPISDKEIEHILDNVAYIITSTHKEPYNVFVEMDY